jgi:hypothetical protein
LWSKPTLTIILVSITDATKTCSIDAFALAIAFLEIAKTAVSTAEQKAEGKNDPGGLMATDCNASSAVHNRYCEKDLMEMVDSVWVGAFGFTTGFLIGFGLRSGISASRRKAARRRRAIVDSMLAEQSSTSNVEDQ